MQILTQDLRYGARMLLKQPGFTLIAVLTLALGIGATTAIFSVVNALVFRSLPFTEAERLVWIANVGADGLSGQTTRMNNFLDWRNLNQSFTDLAGYFAFSDYESFSLTGSGEPERLTGYFITQNFLPLLGVQPLLGRNFDADESRLNGRKAVLLSYGFWRRRFGGDAKIVGQTITLKDQATVVVGVLPPTFDFASTFTPGTRVDLLAPFPMAKELDRIGNTLAVIGKLKPGSHIPQAQAEFDALNQQLQKQYPARGAGFGARMTDLQQQINGRFQRGLWVLLAAVGCVLLIACANLSNLMLVRASARRKEIALRLALGATRWRLVRQMLTESVLLAVAGAAVGLSLALFATDTIASTNAFSLPLLQSVKVDMTALLFTLAVTIGTGLLFGMMPALQATGTNVQEDLQDATRGSSGGKQRGRLRDTLVVAEIALACVLLIGAGLLMRSFWQVLQTDPGFRAERTAVWRIEPGQKYDTPGKKNALYAALTERVAALPGVVSVGLTDTLPLGRNRSWDVRVKGQAVREGIGVFPRMIDPGYRTTMGIALRAGRDFTKFDTEKTEQVTMISEALAHRLFPGQEAVGRQVITGDREYRVTGVVSSVRHSSLEAEAEPEMYFPLAQAVQSSMEMVVRTTQRPAAMAAEIQRAFHSVDANLPARDFRTLEGIVAQSVSPRRFVMLLLGGFAGLALLLAALGIYGVISFSVAQRTNEIGIRIALGAQAADIFKLVLGQGARLIVGGIVIGLLGALALTKVMQSLLYGVSASDLLTFAAITTLISCVALLACWIPARRATKVDPMIALRCE
ncbi:MAG: ABC transporter permease [Acidobacteria bacterium]|nr:ABC transporter permease [Acidobacteriota bacterium]MBI3426660.1 ABC transporter permease [Acidobacteriota bacterium]